MENSVKTFLNKDLFFNSAHPELRNIEHLFSDLELFIVDTASLFDAVLKKLKENHTAEKCIELIILSKRNFNIHKPTTLEELFAYRLIADKLEQTTERLLLNTIVPYGCEPSKDAEQEFDDWLRLDSKRLINELNILFEREKKRFPIVYYHSNQLKDKVWQIDREGANGRWWVAYKEDNQLLGDINFDGEKKASYNCLKDIFLKCKDKSESENYEECLEALRMVKDPIITPDNKYRLGPRQKGAFTAWCEILKLRGRIISIPNEAMANLLNKEFDGLNLYEDGCTLGALGTTSYKKYYTPLLKFIC